jgi:hypothetical protein
VDFGPGDETLQNPKALSKPSRIDQVHQEDPGIPQTQMTRHSWTQILVVWQKEKTSMSCSLPKIGKQNPPKTPLLAGEMHG